ncbi:glycoside hydrolase family 2 protein [Arcticibacter eurypsychrophilus]|uniref:glycoside hydrolase family 2 protein n=1 Tax=Arcticibacter eurypsychrophilus TaxID=1434752 RepID=UPI00084DA4ED|nr:glycoside hydrolase family 2 [Arcticibacter eurypsychrophilus]
MKLIRTHIILVCLFLYAGITLQAQETQQLFLSGTGSDHTVNWQFYVTGGMQAGKWASIAVPSNWELQGFGKYDYGFSKDSLRGKEQGLYKYTFRVADQWKGKKVNIVFEGSMTDTEVKVNGKLAGPIHQGSFYSFKYDVSKLVKYGADNVLEVKVSKHSANKSVNSAEREADFWLFGGIFRPVFLEALPQNRIERVSIDAQADGTFKALVRTMGNADHLEVSLFTADGRSFGEAVKDRLNKKNGSVLLNGAFKSPDLWSSEFPNLYKAVFTLYQKGKIVHTVSQKFGFRTVVVKLRDGMYVNGAKIKFKGVNRHSFSPESGRTTNKDLSISDVLLMKEMNMNAVRMSHYPPDGHFLDVCDSLGLYVMDELAGWHGTYDTPTGSKLLEEMIVHDENHPSIVFWANGNEGGHNLDLDTLFRQFDFQKRPIIHPWQLFDGFETQHYREYDYGIGNYMHGHEIVMPTEFLHGMYDGGHGAGLEDYWREMWRNPLSAGGFLWDFADQGVVRTDKNDSIDTDGNHASDGIVGPHHEKEGSFFAIKEIWSPVYIEHREIAAGFDGTFQVENRYSFANLNQVGFTWKLTKLKGLQVLEDKSVTGISVSPDLKPLEKGSIQVPLPADWKEYDVLYVTATGLDKKEIFTWSFPITRPAQTALKMVDKNGNGVVKITQTDSLYQATVNGLQLSFSKRTGILQQVRNEKGEIPFNNGPVLQEGLNNFKTFSHRMEGKNLIIESKFDRKNSYNTLQWTIYPSGWLKLKVNYFPGQYFTSIVGINFSYPEAQAKGVEYMGSGPYRVWKNRMKGTQFGVWDKDYNNSATGEYPFQYPEFKGYYANMYWLKFIGKEQSFTVVTENEDLYLRLFTPKVSDDPYHNLEPVFPTGDISFMQGISGVGTKTQKPGTTGPMGMKNIFYDYEKEPTRAKEIVLYFNFSGK